MSFNNLQLIEPVLKALQHEGYTMPTPIQQKAIPAILQKRDLLGCAQTGTGKTAAFVIPLLQLMYEQRQSAHRRHARTLILSPTRELAIQIGESIEAYGRFLDLDHVVIFGGVPQYNQVQSIRRGADIIVATPGRLKDLIQQGHISLQQIKYFVLDEADRMLDMGFVNDVKQIINFLPAVRQSLFFSATIPLQIKQLSDRLLNNPVKIEETPVSSTAEVIEQSIYFTEKQNKQSLLIHLLEAEGIENVLVFTQMKHMADKLARSLNKAGIRTDAIHGNKSQSQRQTALANFKRKKIRVLVATDIAARGIDVDNLTHVINYELPNVAETYVHRIGRTGRAGKSGKAISLCDWGEKVFLSDIQKLIKKTIPVVKGHLFEIKSMYSESIRKNSIPSGSQSARTHTVRKKPGRVFAQ